MNSESLTIGDPTLLADSEPGRSTERGRLVVYWADDRGARTRVVELPDGAEVTVGRSRTATIAVDSERVSRLHARFSRHGNKIEVEDLGSRNGTRVNTERIDAVTEVSSGSEVVMGPVTVVVNLTTRVVRSTPLGSTAYLDERLAAETERGLHYQRPFTLVMVRLEGSDETVDAAIDKIANRLRRMDVIAEYGPDEIAILMPELTAEQSEERAQRLAQAPGDVLGLTVRVGLARFPEHATAAGELLSRARSALRSARVGRDNVVTAPKHVAGGSDSIIIADPQMQRVYSLVAKVADTPMTVLIYGETGVGKEVVAEAVHRASGRKDRAYVRLNCACLPENLLESELFGHEKGAFTGADKRKIGYFEAADGGTLFLDEIGEVTPALQAKLLRVLEEHRFSRVGGTREISVDVRVICATNRDLEAEVRANRFREDLFFRIAAFAIIVPPLRDRTAEIPLLAAQFVSQTASELSTPPPTLSQETERAIRGYAWPGNVRELRNAMERAVVLQSSGVVELEHLPERVRTSAPTSPGAVAVGDGYDMKEQIADVEKASIVAALKECGGNQTRAAQRLGLTRRALIYRMEKYGLKDKPGG